MDTALATINQHKDNYFDFDMTVDGLNADDADVRFVVKFKPDLSLVFPCEHESGSKWTVDMPPVPILENTTYNFVIEVVIDGYYFEPFRGLLNVTGTPDVYVSKPEHSTTKKERKPIEVTAPGSGDRTKGREKSIEQIARETMKKAEEKVDKEEKKETVEETPTEVKKVELPEPKESAVDVDAVIENVRRGKEKAGQDEKDRQEEETRLADLQEQEKVERLAEEARVREEAEVEEKRKKKAEKKRLDDLVEKASEEVDNKKVVEEPIEEDNKLLDKPTPTVEELAKKHDVSIADIRKQLTKGIKAEKEHTSDVKVAKEIALDHLNELPDYYDRLEKVEEVVDPVVVDPAKDNKVKDALKELAAQEPVVEPEPEVVVEEVVDPIDLEKDSKVKEVVQQVQRSHGKRNVPKRSGVRAKKIVEEIEPVVEEETVSEKDKAVKEIVTEAKKPAKKKTKKKSKKKPVKKEPVVEKVDKEKSDKTKKILEEDKSKKPAKKKTKKKLPVKKGDQVTRRRRRVRKN